MMTHLHPQPTIATLKSLYAQAFCCAYPKCTEPLYQEDEQTGLKRLNSTVCHIHARRENGPRWKLDQSPEENRSQGNLVLMCFEHGKAIDDKLNVNAYPPELLMIWKSNQQEEYDRMRRGWMLDDKMAEEVARTSFSDVGIMINNSTLQLAGEGGKAPGAGGGGGGALGRSARGGKGGDGGAQMVHAGKFSLNWTEEEALQPLQPLPDSAMQTNSALNPPPGSGGGGAGAIGESVSGGDGGGGGEIVSALLDLTELRKAGLEQIEFTIGPGGLNGSLPGQHGEDGCDTVVRAISKDGSVLETVRAIGGSGGRSGSSYLPDGVDEVSPEERDSGFQICNLMTVNNAELHEGKFYILGGGWTHTFPPFIPCQAVWNVICTARWSHLQGTAARGFFLSLINPAGHETWRNNLVIPGELFDSGCAKWIQSIGAIVDTEGVWKIRASTSRILFGEFSIHVSVKAIGLDHLL